MITCTVLVIRRHCLSQKSTFAPSLSPQMTSPSESNALTRAYRTAPVLSKTTRQMVPPFVQKLYEFVSLLIARFTSQYSLRLVNAPSTDELIRWSDTGDSFFGVFHLCCGVLVLTPLSSPSL